MIQKILFGVIVLLIIGGYMIARDNDYDLEKDQDDRVSFAKDFSGWAVKLFNNTKDIAEDVKEKEWLPEVNETNK